MFLCGAPAIAQHTSIVIRVRVVDTLGPPIAGANVSVLQGLKEVVSSGTTDMNGARQFVVPRRTEDYQVSARRIGFRRTDRLFPSPGADTISIELRMRRTVETLEAVKVAERESVRRRRYYVDADAIAASKRPIIDALDVILKLRPDMLRGLSGKCPLRNYWVNGRRIRQLVTPVREQTVLGGIKAEHIAEITYADCFDKTVERIGGQAAVFVVLKTGVDFELGVGSFVLPPRADTTRQR